MSQERLRQLADNLSSGSIDKINAGISQQAIQSLILWSQFRGVHVQSFCVTIDVVGVAGRAASPDHGTWQAVYCQAGVHRTGQAGQQDRPGQWGRTEQDCSRTVEWCRAVV